MSETQMMLLKSNLKHLRLPTMHAEFAQLAREASAANEGHEQYLLRLTELEVATRSANAQKARIKKAAFPVEKDFDTYDFSAIPNLNKQKILELARGEWIENHYNCCLIGSPEPVTYYYTSLRSWNRDGCIFDVAARGLGRPRRAA